MNGETNPLSLLTARDRSLLATGWDAAIKSLVYTDGSPVEIVTIVNPFREASS